jgi:hypothetical protein
LCNLFGNIINYNTYWEGNKENTVTENEEDIYLNEAVQQLRILEGQKSGDAKPGWEQSSSGER